MYYKLHEDFLLRGWQKLPYALVRKNSGVAFISRKEMQALELCNGKIDTNLPLIPGEVRALLPKMAENGVIVPCEMGDSISAE